jgi:hypothetical protein
MHNELAGSWLDENGLLHPLKAMELGKHLDLKYPGYAHKG